MPKPAKPRKMPKFTPAPEALVALFHESVAGLPNVETRRMFSYPAAFLNGQMLASIFADRIMLRLSEADRARFLKLPEAKPFEVMPGRPMREYVEVPPRIMNSPAQFKRWLKLGMAYVETLPPKGKKKA
jgi:TfoX/Sxy family transcriptional regulator of competence genes